MGSGGWYSCPGGEAEAERAEQAVRDTGAEVTVVRSTWFAQNFSEDYMLEQVLTGTVALPAGDTPEPFVDADDIADAKEDPGQEAVLDRLLDLLLIAVLRAWFARAGADAPAWYRA